MNTQDKDYSTSREIAELTGKLHKNVLRDIDDLLNSLKLELRLGFKLSTYQDSTGRTLREFILDQEAKDLVLMRYRGLARVPNRLQEEAALKTIEQILGITLIRQFKVGEYYIDGYDTKSNTAYEIDEPDHNHKRQQDSERQQKITQILGCKFVRIIL